MYNKTEKHDYNVALETLDLNLHGVVRVVDKIAPTMKEGTKIVNVSSGLGSLSGINYAEVQERLRNNVLTRPELAEVEQQYK
jgi:short-subunit dehydrogenase involved in D-alanine esterification of teichoic acids